MKYSSHVAISVSTITLFEPWNYGLYGCIFIYLMAVIGGLLPDIDHPHSFIGSKIPLIPTILFKMDGHRGFTHGLPALMVVFMIGAMISESIGMGMLNLCGLSLGFGYFTHLGADFITNRGIPLFKPFVVKRYVLPITKTGQPLEGFIVIAFCGISLAFTAGSFGLI